MTTYIAVLGLLITANMAMKATSHLRKKFHPTEFFGGGDADDRSRYDFMVKEAKKTIFTAFLAGLMIGGFVTHMGHTVMAAPQAPKAQSVHIDNVPSLKEMRDRLNRED